MSAIVVAQASKTFEPFYVLISKKKKPLKKVYCLTNVTLDQVRDERKLISFWCSRTYMNGYKIWSETIEGNIKNG